MIAESDTIAAISTPPGEGGIAVIRISGPQAVQAADRVFRGRRPLAEVPSHTVHYGFVRDPDTGETADEVLATVMRAPRSFTREDVVEISCHGGMIAVRKVLELLLSAGGVRLAEPGEFTKRAFLNGRIDLSQAEAVIDLIRAKSDQAHNVAMKQASGALSGKIRDLRGRLVELMAHIEVNIDYPEHDVEEMTNRFIREKCAAAMAEIDRLLNTASQGKILREGITTAIVGRPNVGKSSLLNALAQENKAIVTDIPGTTRDVIEEYVNVGGIPLRLLDTAGIRETADLVEKIGVERSLAALEDADLLLLVINGNEPLDGAERELMARLAGRQTIVIVNKTDLPVRVELEEIKSMFPAGRIVMMAAARHEGIDALERAIRDLFFSGEIASRDLTYVSNVRHIHLLKESRRALGDALAAAEEGMPIDLIQIDLQRSWEALGEIIGEAVSESLIDQIFSQFCLGK